MELGENVTRTDSELLPDTNCKYFACTRNTCLQEKIVYVEIEKGPNKNQNSTITMPRLSFLDLLVHGNLQGIITTSMEVLKTYGATEKWYIQLKISSQSFSLIQKVLTKQNIQITKEKFQRKFEFQFQQQQQYLSHLLMSNSNMERTVRQLLQQENINCLKLGQIFIIQEKISLPKIKNLFTPITNYYKFEINFQSMQTTSQSFQQLSKFLENNIKKWAIRYKFEQGSGTFICIETFSNYQILMVIKKCTDLNIEGCCIKAKEANSMPLWVLQQYHPRDQLIPVNYKQELLSIIKLASKQDFVHLLYNLNNSSYSIDNFQNDLKFILNNWEIYRPDMEEYISDLQDLIEYRIFKMPFDIVKIIYPTIDKLRRKLQRVNEYVGDLQKLKKNEKNEKEELKVEEKRSDIQFKKFLNQGSIRTQKLEQAAKKKHPQKQPIEEEDITQNEDQISSPFGTAQWQDVFARMQIHERNEIQKKEKQSQKIKMNIELRYEFLNNIEGQRLLSYQCISCCPFFYTDMNISDPFINKTPILTMERITKVQEEQEDLKNKVCYLMNNGGGVILFDCKLEYRGVIPKGEFITLLSQDAYLQKIYHIIESISPNAQVGENIQATFVPMVPNPMHNAHTNTIVKRTDKSYEQSFYLRPSIQGKYVTRIKVKPTVGWRTYYWLAEGKPIIPEKVGERKFKPMSGKKMNWYLRSRFEKYYIPDEMDPREREERLFFAPQVSCFHHGQCMRADPGAPFTDKPPEKPNKLYKYVSLLIARKKDHSMIEQRLREKKIQCEVVNLHHNLNFKAAANSAVLYHNMRFDRLLEEMSYNKAYQFAGKGAMVVYVAEFLKLPNMRDNNLLKQQDFDGLKMWMEKHYPQEKVSFWRYQSTPRQYEYYVSTNSKESTVLMYYVLTQYGEKCFFKNPKNYDKLTEAEKKNRIKVYYPKTPSKSESGVKGIN